MNKGFSMPTIPDSLGEWDTNKIAITLRQLIQQANSIYYLGEDAPAALLVAISRLNGEFMSRLIMGGFYGKEEEKTTASPDA